MPLKCSASELGECCAEHRQMRPARGSARHIQVQGPAASSPTMLGRKVKETKGTIFAKRIRKKEGSPG